jgi:hypothetical protein
MGSINIHGVPNAGVGYSLTGKKVMVHDPVAPLATSTVLVDATDLGSAGGYSAPMWTEAGGDMTEGSTTFTDASLIGATEMNFIIVNKVIEFIDEDYTFNNLTGTITRTNEWQEGDKMVTPHKQG